MIETLTNEPIYKLHHNVNVHNIVLGAVMQLCFDEKEVCLNISDGLYPFGFIKEIIDYKYVRIQTTRHIILTDQFDTKEKYMLNNNLFVENGKFTTKQPGPDYPGIGIVIDPPRADFSQLKLMWL